MSVKRARALTKPRRRAARDIPKARRVRTPPLSRIDVTRAEYNQIIDVLNERITILNALRETVRALEHASEIQFKRFAQLQADVDRIARALDRRKP